MKKLCSALVFLFFVSAGVCQSFRPTAKQVSKLFKASIDQPKKGSISIGSGAWTICNQDSSFFKSDTLRLYNNINYFYQISGCCDFIEWTFYKKNAFVQGKSQICKEPSTGSAKVDHYEISLWSEKGKTYLLVKKPNQSAVKFEVIKIDDIKLAQNNSTKEITLRRAMSYPYFIR